MKLHQLGYTHNDLKPENIMFGLGNGMNKSSRQLYLVDTNSSSIYFQGLPHHVQLELHSPELPRKARNPTRSLSTSNKSVNFLLSGMDVDDADVRERSSDATTADLTAPHAEAFSSGTVAEDRTNRLHEIYHSLRQLFPMEH